MCVCTYIYVCACKGVHIFMCIITCVRVKLGVTIVRDCNYKGLWVLICVGVVICGRDVYRCGARLIGRSRP